MPFIGSINEKLRKYFWKHAALLEGRRCYIGCSGNFTIEQIISRRCKGVEVYSNDVSLYTSVIGHMLTSKKVEMEIINPELTWANNYLKEGPAESVSSLLILLEMLKYEKRSSEYAERMWQAYLVNFEKMFHKTTEKVKKASDSIKIKEYTMTDVYNFYPKSDGVSIGFLPTYVGGYEKLFARLEESVEWEKPHYELLTAERRNETIKRMKEGEYILYDDNKRDMPCIARVDLFGKKTIYIYSNIDFRHGIFRKKINEKTSHYNLLLPEETMPDNADINVKEIVGK